MNGCRRTKKAKELLELRMKMDLHKIEINDTTVKFTALAHMMLGDTESAVKAFMQFHEAVKKKKKFSKKRKQKKADLLCFAFFFLFPPEY